MARPPLEVADLMVTEIPQFDQFLAQ